MAKTRSLEGKLARLRLLRHEPASPPVLQELRAALADASNLLAAEAAEIVAKAPFAELVPELGAAFDRFLDDPVKTDPLCRAKTAIAEALNQLEYAGEDLFWRGARHVQLEPAWGGSRDTAAALRVTCAFALVRTHAHGVMPFLVDLLTDSEKVVRVGAVQALAYSETEAAGLLLRLKARLGDKEPDVIAECFTGLIKLSPAQGVPFVSPFLGSPEEAIQEAAILALGDSRRREAFDILKAFFERHANDRLQETVLMALSLLRLSEATDYVLELVAGGPKAVAWSAVSALALHRYDDRLRDRTAAAVTKSGQAGLQAHFERRFHLHE